MDICPLGLGKLFTLHTEITFADETTDEIFLKPDPENDCFYHGALKGDIESEVEVDGCKNDAEIVEIRDSSLGSSSFSFTRRPSGSSH